MRRERCRRLGALCLAWLMCACGAGHSRVRAEALNKAEQTPSTEAAALAAYEEAVRLKSHDADAQFGMGMAHLAMSQYDRALGPFQNVARLEPKKARGFFQLGYTFFQMKRPNDAIAALSRAIAIEPKHVQAHAGLALTYQALGRDDDAMREYQTLRSLDAKLAEQLLEQLNQSARASASRSATALNAPIPIKFGGYTTADLSVNPGVLDEWTLRLKQDPMDHGYVIAYGGRTSGPDDAQRAGNNARNYAIEVHGVSPDRLLVVVGGYREKPTIELWLRPRDGAEPELTPTVDPQDVTPATRRRR